MCACIMYGKGAPSPAFSILFSCFLRVFHLLLWPRLCRCFNNKLITKGHSLRGGMLCKSDKPSIIIILYSLRTACLQPVTSTHTCRCSGAPELARIPELALPGVPVAFLPGLPVASFPPVRPRSASQGAVQCVC